MEMIYKHRYRLLRPLGKGGQGEVYLVEDLHVKKLWAMKILKCQKETEGEIQALRSLNHKYLPMIVDLISMENQMGIVMEYVEGETLEHYLRREGAISQEQAVIWAIKLTEVLHYLHTRNPSCLYGDMKPANIMVTKQKGIKLIDLGTVMGERERNHHEMVGTPGYVPPEKECDSRSDIYSLGVTLHYMVTGNNPGIPGNQIRPVREYNGTLSRGLERILKRCLEVNPSDRYQTCRALGEDLKNLSLLDRRLLWEYRVTKATYFLLFTAGISVMGVQLYRVVKTGRGDTGYLLYSMVCAAVAYLMKKICLDGRHMSRHYYRQDISILKTEKDLRK